MSRIVLSVLGAVWFATGIYIILAPEAFYEATPGLSAMGPFNVHFIRDVGLVFLASGGAAVWSARSRNRAVAMAAVAWPALHALFHIQIWAHRGFPFDGIAFFDALAVVAPAAIAVWAALDLKTETAS